MKKNRSALKETARGVRGALTACIFAAMLSRVFAGPDFTMILQPGSATLIPGTPSSFLVSLSPLGGFNSAVALSVGTLPAGISASFSPAQVTPPGSSVLTLTAAGTAALGPFPLNITGAGGGVTNTSAGSVTVNFGLLPSCFGAIQGTVSDPGTGLPLPGALVEVGGSFATANASGHYIFTNLALNNDNAPAQYPVSATLAGYVQMNLPLEAYAVCDATNTADILMSPQLFGSMSGTVTNQAGQPLAGISVSAEGQSATSIPTTTTDTNGNYQFTHLSLVPDNGPTLYDVSFVASSNYWGAAAHAYVLANSNTVVDAGLILKCMATATGQVVYAATGLPATNVEVVLSSGGGAFTDDHGDYTILLDLGTDNTPIIDDIATAIPPSGYSAEAQFSVTQCLQVVSVPLITLPAPPVTNYGGLTGHIYDSQTGLPVTNAEVIGGYSGDSFYVYTDASGAYYVTNFAVGAGSVTNLLIPLTVDAGPYFSAMTNVTIEAGLTATQDVRLVRVAYGWIVGTVVDSITQLPVTNALVNQTPVGPGGSYSIGPLPLSPPANSPVRQNIDASAAGYWTSATNTTILAGQTNLINFQLIRVCPGATILGNVVNALTQQPITNAVVVADNTLVARTDQNGNYILTNIVVGDFNSPSEVSLSASAPGFNPQSQTVTIFCDATITADFGARQTVFGAIDGYVTNSVTGQPLFNVFVGSQFGGATTTDTNGYYKLTNAPLSANGASRTWSVTAIPSGFPAETEFVVVSSNTVSRLDFGFGQPLTTLSVGVTAAPNPVMVGSNLVFTATLQNSGAAATNVVFGDDLPPGVTFIGATVTNNIGEPFSAPALSNNIVAVSTPLFSSNATAVLSITVLPTTAGSVTNLATVASGTPDRDSTGSNHTASVTAVVNAPAPLLADLALGMTAAPNPALVSNQVSFVLIVTNLGPADAPAVVVADALPTNAVFVSATFSQGVFTQGAGGLTWSLGALAGGTTATGTVVVLPAVTGTVANSATAALGGGGVTDPNLANNTAAVEVTVTAPAQLLADLAVGMTAAPNPALVSNQVSFVLIVTNLGPADAPAVVLADTLPTNAAFVSATFSQGVFTQGVGGLTWSLGALAGGTTATGTVVVLPAVIGTVANSATAALAGGGVTDPNLANNTAAASVTVNAPAPTGVAISPIGPIVFSPQTGLFDQNVQFNNLGAAPIAAVQLSVLGLPPDVTLYNARGSSHGAPFVEYDLTLAPGASVVFALEYYRASRQVFVSTNFAATVVAASPPPAPTGPVLQLDRTPDLSLGQLTIEFTSVPGTTYVVQYSSDAQTWLSSAPPVVATGTRTQWVDAGPPKTASPPGAPGLRFYRVVQLP